MTSTKYHGRPWRRLRAQVLREEPVRHYCRIRASETLDHVVPRAVAPHLAYESQHHRSAVPFRPALERPPEKGNLSWTT